MNIVDSQGDDKVEITVINDNGTKFTDFVFNEKSKVSPDLSAYYLNGK